MSINMNNVIRGFFWLAFAAFLSASIPHVAYFFRAFEPMGDGQDIYWWGVAFAIAISIDVTIFLLSITVAQMHRQKKSWGLIASVWIFIVGLTSLSFFINWEYATQFSSSMLANVDRIHLNIFTIGQINPLIASMFQVLAVAYTWISDKISADEPEKSADDLEQEALELERKVMAKKTIATLKDAQKSHRLKSLIATAKDVKKELFTHPVDTQNAVVDEAHIEEENHLEKREIPVAIMEENAIPLEDEETEETPDENTVQREASIPTTGPLSVTVNEAALLLNLSPSYIRELRDKKKVLKAPARNKKLVTMRSINEYKTTRQKSPQKDQDTEHMPALKLVQ